MSVGLLFCLFQRYYLSMNISHFTPEQCAVTAHRKGHALVSAVAGSGKTDVLVARTVAMLHEGTDPDHMLILMFNKSAQEVFVQRIKEFCTEKKLPAVLTFHALGKQILDIWAERKFTAAPMVVEDIANWLELLCDVVEKVNTNGAGYSTHLDQLRKYLSGFDILKNMDYPHAQINIKTLGWSTQFYEQTVTLFKVFEEHRKSLGWVGLNDLLYDAVFLLRSNTDYALEWRDSLTHIMVDEYQDSNSLQHWLIGSFLHSDSSLMVVGDEDQCIYTWRAADPNMMVNGFELRYPGASRYTLSRTFRYGHAVALMANYVLQHNKVRPDKMVISGLEKAGNIEILRVLDQSHAVPHLKRLDSKDAILVREFRHADDVELICRFNNIPYRLEGAPLFTQRPTGLALSMSLGCTFDRQYKSKNVEQAKAWIRWVDPSASSVFVENIAIAMTEIGVEQAIRNAMHSASLSTRQQDHLVQMLVLNNRLGDARTHQLPISTIRQQLSDSWARSAGLEKDRPSAPLMLSVLHIFDNMKLSDLMSWLDNWCIHDDGVLLTSIHRAKGGGWPKVYLPHTEHNRFPSSISEEERRLFYVAITRAQEELLLAVPTDPVRDFLWQNPSVMDISSYSGPTGVFMLESMPEYARKIAREWILNKAPVSDVLTGVAQRYEAILYPDAKKSYNLWQKLFS